MGLYTKNCHKCDGTGIRGKKECRHCNGEGWVNRTPYLLYLLVRYGLDDGE